MLQRDNLKLGLVLGFIAPVFGFTAYYLFKFRRFTVNEFWEVLMMQKSLLSGIISIALLADAILFTLYINKQKDKTAAGIFIATCTYAIVALFFKWFT